MSIIYMLLAISVIVALLFFAAFIISVKKGQYDDTYTPSVRMLFEEETIKKTDTKTNQKSKRKSIILNDQSN
ncbi:cbb3-type cytochrome oxidase assembly protein CcoS [Pontimicrobium sp. MEBiC01747]